MSSRYKPSVEYARGDRFDIDLGSSRGGEVSIVFTTMDKIQDYGEEAQAESKKTVLTAIPLFKEDGTVDMTIKEGTRRLDTSVATIYTRETIGFETNKDVANGLRSTYDSSPEIDELLLLDLGHRKVILTIPQEIRTSFNGELMDKEEKDTQKDVEKKSGKERVVEELKAYETPSNIFRSMFKAIDHATFKKYLTNSVGEKLLKKITTNKEIQRILEDKVGNNNLIRTASSTTVYLISEAMNTGGEEGRKMLENEDSHIREGMDAIVEHLESGEDVGIANMLQTISDTYELGKKIGFMNVMREEEIRDAWKEAFGFTPKENPTIPVFDPQAGSGEGILKGMEEANFNGMLQGVELRDMGEAKAKFGEKYNVLDNTNTMLFADSIRQVFLSGKTSAPDHMLTYTNPPYTADDEVSKRTVDMFPNGTLMTGLYPEKMKTYLAKNLSSNSLIMSIPKSITGYTDPKTPERFIFIMGTKHNSMEKLNDGLDNMATSRSASPKELTLPMDASEKMFEKALSVHIEQNSSLDTLFLKASKYYEGAQHKAETIQKDVVSSIEAHQNMLQNREKLLEVMDDAKDGIIKKMMPIEIAKKQKIFKDTRFYSKEGVYERLGFIDVVQNIPLLTYYRDSSPAVFGLIAEVAKELEIRLPIDTDVDMTPFRFGEKPTGKKDKVTNMALGMMKLHYYPSRVDISSREDKDIMLSLLTSIYGNDATEDDLSSIEAALELSHSVIIKNKKVVRTDVSMVMPKEIFVLQDEYGFDVGELGIELDEFYDIIQEKGFYDIKDYVEVAKLTSEKKSQIMKAFLEDMGHSIREIANFNNIPEEDVKADIINTGIQIEKLRRNKKIAPNEINGEIFDFAKKYDMKGMFLDLFRTDETAFKKKLNAITKMHFDIDAKKAQRVSNVFFDTFIQNPISFYEDHQEEFFAKLENSLKKDYDDYDKLMEDMETYKEEALNIMNPIYQVNVVVATSYGRLSEMLIRRYAVMEAYIGNDKKVSDENINKVFDGVFAKMFLTTMGLKPHQFNEAINYAALEDQAKLSLLGWEPRGGKSRAFMASGYLLSLMKDTDINLVLETATIHDMSLQMVEAFPFLALRARYFIDEGNLAMNPKNIYNTLPTNEVVPKPYLLIEQSKMKGGGKATKELASRFGKDIEMIVDKLKEKYGESPDAEAMLKEIAKDHSKSPFIKILKTACPKS